MPKNRLTYRKGDIRWVKLDPTMGAEAQKTRAYLIVQSDVINKYGLLMIVMPLMRGHKNAPYVVNIKATSENGLDCDRYLDVAQYYNLNGIFLDEGASQPEYMNFYAKIYTYKPHSR